MTTTKHSGRICGIWYNRDIEKEHEPFDLAAPDAGLKTLIPRTILILMPPFTRAYLQGIESRAGFVDDPRAVDYDTILNAWLSDRLGFTKCGERILMPRVEYTNETITCLRCLAV